MNGMPKVHFKSEDLTVEVEAGASLVDAIEKAGAKFPLGCRMGSCGTCRCIITEGAENVNDLTEPESDLFETLTHVHQNERLGCQLQIQGDVSIQA